MEEEQLFLFQVTVDNIVITDKSCMSGKDGNDRIFVKIKYPDLNWIELDQVDFSSFQGKRSSKQSDRSDTSPSVIKLLSNQIFYSKRNIVCNEGKSFLVSMSPTLLCTHFMANVLQVTLYQPMFVAEACWTIGTGEFHIGHEMAQLVLESLKHPDLHSAPAAMDKQFPLHGAFGKVCGNLQCTIYISCAGKTTEFGMRNACYIRSFTSEETLDVEENSVETVEIRPKNSALNFRPKCRNGRDVSRCRPAGDIDGLDSGTEMRLRNSGGLSSAEIQSNRGGNVSRCRPAGDIKESFESVVRMKQKDRLNSGREISAPKNWLEEKIGGKISRCMPAGDEENILNKSFKIWPKESTASDASKCISIDTIEDNSSETGILESREDSVFKIWPKDKIRENVPRCVIEENGSELNLENAAEIRPRTKPSGQVGNGLKKASKIWPKETTRGYFSKHILADIAKENSSKNSAKIKLKSTPGENGSEYIIKSNILRHTPDNYIQEDSLGTMINFERAANSGPKKKLNLESSAKIRLKERPRGIMSRLIPTNNDVFSYYKGEELNILDRNESFVSYGKAKAVAIPPNNNSTEHFSNSLPARRTNSVKQFPNFLSNNFVKRFPNSLPTSTDNSIEDFPKCLSARPDNSKKQFLHSLPTKTENSTDHFPHSSPTSTDTSVDHFPNSLPTRTDNSTEHCPHFLPTSTDNSVDHVPNSLAKKADHGFSNSLPAKTDNSSGHFPNSEPTRTDLTEITSEFLDERIISINDFENEDDLYDDRPLAFKAEKRADTRDKVPVEVLKTPRNVSSFSTVSEIPMLRAKVRRNKQRQKSTSKEQKLSQTVPRSTREISNKKSKVNSHPCFPTKPIPTKSPKIRNPATEHNPITIKKAKGLAFEGPENEGLSLSIVKQNSVFHVAIKNSDNELGNVLKFKLYGEEEEAQRNGIPRKDPLSVTVIPTQRN